MSSYKTEELIGTLERTVVNYHAGLYPDIKYIDEKTINAIIARLLAWENLREVIRKAIADYEGKE
jgi:hypothetical protein